MRPLRLIFVSYNKCSYDADLLSTPNFTRPVAITKKLYTSAELHLFQSKPCKMKFLSVKFFGNGSRSGEIWCRQKIGIITAFVVRYDY